MSEVVETPAAEPVASSTADVASQLIDTFDSAPEGESAPESAPTPVVEPELTPAQKFLLEQGHRADNGRGGKTYLPYATVEKMLERYLTGQQKTWDEEKGKFTTKAEQLQAAVDSYLSAVRGDPKAFLSEIAQHDPRYQVFLQPPPAPEQPKAPLQFPAPDLQLPDGSSTYTMKGLQEQVFPWMLEQAREVAKKEAAAALEPVTKREKEAQEQSELRERTRAQIETAKTWEKWDEWHDDILGKLRADTQTAQAAGKRPTMTLREAYLEVKAEKLAAERQTVRGDVLKELSTAPKSTSIPRTAGATPAPVKPRSTSEVAARNLERLERGA